MSHKFCGLTAAWDSPRSLKHGEKLSSLCNCFCKGLSGATKPTATHTS